MKTSRTKNTAIGTICFVIGVLALVSLPLPKLMPVSDDAKRKIAVGDIANISLALKMYRLRTGRYPSAEEGLHVLTKPLKEYNNEPCLEQEPLDRWGTPYHYSIISNVTSISSAGSDRKIGTGDDITLESARQ